MDSWSWDLELEVAIDNRPMIELAKARKSF